MEPWGYAYKASHLCTDCAKETIRELEAEGKTDDGTTDNWPQPCWDEVDYPAHCECGEFLENPLTTDGVDYVKDMYREDGEVPDEYKKRYDFIDFDELDWEEGCFSVQIELGNKDMKSAGAVADALAHLADKVREGNTNGVVLDVNGNVVGNYTITY